MPHLRHLPGLSSRTSSSPAIVQTYDSGGRFSVAAGFDAVWRAIAGPLASATARMPMTSAARLIPLSLCYTVGRMKTRWLVAVVAALPLVAGAQTSRVDAAFQAFWSAASPAAAAAGTGAIVQSGVSFDEAYKRLTEGRTYRPQPAGVVRLSHRTSTGVEHPYGVDVPAGYDHTRQYRARIQLHGGVM